MATETKWKTLPSPDARSPRPGTPAVSVVLFCSENVVHTPAILEQLLEFLEPRSHDHELVVALDGHLGGLHARFLERTQDLSWVRLVRLHAALGQVATIRAGVSVARGQRIVTYPAYPQVTPEGIDTVAERLDHEEYVIATRRGGARSGFNRMARKVFNGLIAMTTGIHFRDLACGLHGMRSYVVPALSGYGQNQLFLPILIAREGFRVGQVEVDPDTSTPNLRLFGPATFGRRALDVMTLAYLVRFTQKPLRPFGALGLILLLSGAVMSLVLAYQRMVLGQALAERPLLLLALLLITAGVQVIILGFLGELLLYLHFRDQSNYRISEWFRGGETETLGLADESGDAWNAASGFDTDADTDTDTDAESKRMPSARS